MNLPFKFDRWPAKKEGIWAAGGMALAALLAWFSPVGRWTELFSYDVIAVSLRDAPPADTLLIYLDERAHNELGQPYDRPWDRRLHSRLLDRLREEGARLVYFDIVFEKTSPDPTADLEFAQAISRHGNVVLGGNAAVHQETESMLRGVTAPLAMFRRAARAWGSLSFVPIDEDSGVRRVPLPVENIEHSAIHAARLLRGESAVASPATEPKWIHYAGPPGTFAAISYHQALAPDGVPPGIFKDKVVLIGAKYSTGFSGSLKDSFATPYSRFGFEAMSGTEVNAHLLATLRSDQALRKLDPRVELALLLAGSAALAWILLALLPSQAALLVLAVMVVSSAFAWASGTWYKIWGNWFLFSGGIAPAALVVSVGRNFYVERRQRQKVTRAFEKYLSPEMVRHVSLSSVDLKPGGTTRRVTALMTDIEGFSSIAETLSAEEVSRMLIAYFSQLTRHVFDHKGTVVQFVGDSLYCVWGAPLEQATQADLALRAAFAIQASTHGLTFEGRTLPTRIGLSTGDGLCGNLGSAERFDYAVIGDNTNLAARIESANKTLGTRVLLSESTKRALREPWILRDVGDFLVTGRIHPIRLWEPVAEGTAVPAEWAQALPPFAQGLSAWRQEHWQEAERFFRSAQNHRGSRDGPAEFYLKTLHEDRERKLHGPIRL